MSSHSPEPSLGEVFIANRAHLWRVARKIVNTADLADDVVQDAYLKLVDGPCMRHADRPIGYCCQVVRNMALDYCRRHRVEASYRTFDIDVEQLDMPATAATPDRMMCERQVICAIDKVLAGLAPRTRMVFELYRLEGLTQREIAQRLGCALGLVNGLIAEAAMAIKTCGHLLFESDSR
ncbi:sigma-70 family RNA polymerase sigma factor [Variovorax ginsengisoli]|uniref:RNA polymerase sigma-70 factor (ECF subfamily) n=1 Tax=Variovorax ginsengisoli TaxID=363844 RepID=A0ABT9SBJ8_9BURK|nr:sigma-70 family RNA polymerase sigma factor [Variovorax ginsengisoli]MDP9901722.1 RNA polymerase sigma-70 factor (ECF subfamily) [Variovorax ginsengisoli]